jgi:predicted nicotinamide N-methyase
LASVLKQSSEAISIPAGKFDIQMLIPPEREEHGSRLSCWWGITTASVALSRHIASLDSLAEKKAIELGCGLGLAGITAGLSGANILFTDYMPEALHFAEENCRLNGLGENETGFRVLDWEAPREVEQFDLILGAEIVYDYFFHGSLIKLIDSILARDGVLLLADRKRLVVSRFLGRLLHNGFDCAETPMLIQLEGFPRRKTSVFEIRRR